MPEVEAAAYFSVSEALTNVLKHSGADSAEVVLACPDGWLDITVLRRGAGFDTGARRSPRSARACATASRRSGAGSRCRAPPDAGTTLTAPAAGGEPVTWLRTGAARRARRGQHPRSRRHSSGARGRRRRLGRRHGRGCRDPAGGRGRRTARTSSSPTSGCRPATTWRGSRPRTRSGERWPSTGVVVLSQYADEAYAFALLRARHRRACVPAQGADPRPGRPRPRAAGDRRRPLGARSTGRRRAGRAACAAGAFEALGADRARAGGALADGARAAPTPVSGASCTCRARPSRSTSTRSSGSSASAWRPSCTDGWPPWSPSSSRRVTPTSRVRAGTDRADLRRESAGRWPRSGSSPCSSSSSTGLTWWIVSSVSPLVAVCGADCYATATKRVRTLPDGPGPQISKTPLVRARGFWDRMNPDRTKPTPHQRVVGSSPTRPTFSPTFSPTR